MYQGTQKRSQGVPRPGAPLTSIYRGIDVGHFCAKIIFRPIFGDFGDFEDFSKNGSYPPSYMYRAFRIPEIEPLHYTAPYSRGSHKTLLGPGFCNLQGCIFNGNLRNRIFMSRLAIFSQFLERQNWAKNASMGTKNRFFPD